MNVVENDARPFLEPLISGAPVTLDAVEMSTVARWITLKCLVVEHASSELAVTPRADREAFKIAGIIPPYFRIYVANHNVEIGVSLIRHSRCIVRDISAGPQPPLLGMPNNIQTITFFLGRVLVHLNAARVENLHLEDRVIHTFEGGSFWDLTRLWPARVEPVRWPRLPLLAAETVDLISDTLDTYVRASKTTWID